MMEVFGRSVSRSLRRVSVRCSEGKDLDGWRWHSRRLIGIVTVTTKSKLLAFP